DARPAHGALPPLVAQTPPAAPATARPPAPPATTATTATPVAQPTTVPPPPAPRSAAPAVSAGSPTPARAPINPFLANDPNAKARRLARALVSDLVTYFPQRREEGLRDGTLRELFREEIKKSFEEYVDQVGKEFAESTTHFNEALNDILAGGQKLF